MKENTDRGIYSSSEQGGIAIDRKHSQQIGPRDVGQRTREEDKE